MDGYFKICHNILCEVLRDNAYLSIAIARNTNSETPYKPLINKIVNGVVENNSILDRKIDQFLKNTVKPKIKIIFKIVAFCHIYLDTIPDYAIVNNAIELSKDFNQGQYKGLVTAVSRKIVQLEKEKEEKVLSVPDWLKEIIIKTYGEVAYKQIVNKNNSREEVHIRVNSRIMKSDCLENKLIENKIEYEKSFVGGYFVKYNDFVKLLFDTGTITVQSPSSMLAVDCLDIKDSDCILDICSAPGGKAIYCEEKASNVTVYAEELHEHRVKLINSYKSRMNSNIIVKKSDARECKKEYLNKFDSVIVDAPCSSTGLIVSKADILLTKKFEDILSIPVIQLQILENASKYVKQGGTLLYSTCSIMPQENANVVTKFLQNNKEYQLEKITTNIKELSNNDGTIQLLPSKDWDGFFIAKMRKNHEN